MFMAPAKKSKNYFTQETENAIVSYNNSSDFEEKNKIYYKEIHYAFFKLTENLIHTFKFYHTEVDDIEDLQHEVITFLLSKIHKFDPSKGSKAYSYFGTIAKRYLILSNQKIYKKKIDVSSLDTIEQDENYSYTINNDDLVERLSLFMNEFINYCTENIYELFPKEQDAKIADAILELFRKREQLDVFNKKALYIFIREQIDVKTPQITKIVDKLYDIFKYNYSFYIENGYIKFK
jgi:DNA-directed RNA polymerase specialized sigma24 family protein